MLLNYQKPDPLGRQIGRYINQPDHGDVVDESEAREVVMRDARLVEPSPRMETMGFECRSWPTQVADFGDDDTVRSTYYAEMIDLVRAASGASVAYIFDHTIRDTANANLNAPAGGSAAPVPRVHNDYTADGAPRRLRQLLAADGFYDGSGKRRHLGEAEVEALLSSNYAFVNVWRSIDPASPVRRQPLAVLDERTVDLAQDAFVYELRFPDRTGENYSLRHANRHAWYYYPHMTFDECLVFKCYDRVEDTPRFVFHTSFEDPSTEAEAPPRRSIEVRAIAFFPRLEDHPHVLGKALFVDMKHSNNAARCRLWLDVSTDRVQRRRDPAVAALVERKVLNYPDLATDDFVRINPLKKVPAFVRQDGAAVFESHVILSYLEDKWGRGAFTPETPEERQTMNLIVRCHDLYIASPNATQPGFSHSQGAMYLSTAWHGEARGMSVETRSAKVAEIWHQVTWLNGYLVGPFLAGQHPSLADLTWYPTCVFMEYMLPRVFGWGLFDAEHSPTPRLAKWYHDTSRADPAFASRPASDIELAFRSLRRELMSVSGPSQTADPRVLDRDGQEGPIRSHRRGSRRRTPLEMGISVSSAFPFPPDSASRGPDHCRGSCQLLHSGKSVYL